MGARAVDRSVFNCTSALSVSPVPSASTAATAGTARRAWTPALMKQEFPRFTKPPPLAAMLREWRGVRLEKLEMAEMADTSMRSKAVSD